MRSADFCPECDQPTDDAGVDRSREACPHCGAPLIREEPSRWVNVARVTNLAEAGFLVDELAGEGVDARIYQSEDFNALTDRWLVSYLIQSPPSDAQAAAARIRRHLAEMESYEPPSGGAWPDERAGGDPLAWRPVALVILAGMASFALGQRLAADRDPKPPRNSLATAISAIGRPLVTEPAVGAPRHRLYYRWREQAWYLDTDADGDGQYEARQRFHSAGASW